MIHIVHFKKFTPARDADIKHTKREGAVSVKPWNDFWLQIFFLKLATK